MIPPSIAAENYRLLRPSSASFTRLEAAESAMHAFEIVEAAEKQELVLEVDGVVGTALCNNAPDNAFKRCKRLTRRARRMYAIGSSNTSAVDLDRHGCRIGRRLHPTGDRNRGRHTVPGFPRSQQH